MIALLYGMSVLSVWRLTYLLTDEDGPFDIFRKFRELFIVYSKDRGWVEAKPKNVIGKMLMCFYCASVWTSIPGMLYLCWLDGNWQFAPIYWLSLSAAAIMIEVLRRRIVQ